MKKLKNNLFNLIIGLIFLAGIGLLGYPFFSDWWNSHMASRAVAGYTETIESLADGEKERVLEKAKAYNERLYFNPGRLESSAEEKADYSSQLRINGTDLMGSIEIPGVDISLPIFHGTSDVVLANGAGHLEGSSLPTGGEGNHTVITGHRGLPSAKLFTDLDRMQQGDFILLDILGDKLTYQVNQIRIVDPTEVASIKKEPDKDQITLVTCTPYGINSHRLLVTGQRVENLKDLTMLNEASLVSAKTVAVCILVLLVLAYVVLRKGFRKFYDY